MLVLNKYMMLKEKQDIGEYVDLGIIWGKVKSITHGLIRGTTSFMPASDLDYNNFYVVYTRYDERIKKHMRLEYGKKILLIHMITDLGEKQQYMQLLTEEETC